ncbi:MAG TPA: CBASS oligonucleotide cyclase [Fimbriimonadaceae bacterium]|jgi:hypothetical protein
MLTIEEAFRKFKSRLELNEREQKNAIDRHTEVRDHIRKKFSIDNDFLTGSYSRHTKTKPLKDIDIFFALGEKEGHYRGKAPSVVLDDFESVLLEKYDRNAVGKQRRSTTVNFGIKEDAEDNTDYRIVSVDVVPAFVDGDDYEIPDSKEGTWIKTNPKTHAAKAVTAHQAYSSEWKGLVRMMKYWNNHNGKPVKPSFLIEVMALGVLYGGFSGQFDREMQSFFATLAARIHDVWPDPAGLGPDVSDMMTAAEKDAAKMVLLNAERQAAAAIHLVRQGQNGDALKAWRSLLGPKFPLS